MAARILLGSLLLLFGSLASEARAQSTPVAMVSTTSVAATETDAEVTIDAITVASSVSDPDGDPLTVSLADARSTPGGVVEELFSTEPTVSLQVAQGGDNEIVLEGGVANADANGEWTATVLLTDGSATPLSVAVVTVSVLPTPDTPRVNIVQREWIHATEPIPMGGVTVSGFTVARVVDPDGDELTLSTVDSSVIEDGTVSVFGDLFTSDPAVEISAGVIRVVSAVVREYGRWTATVRVREVSDGGTPPDWVDVGVVALEVIEYNDAFLGATPPLTEDMSTPNRAAYERSQRDQAVYERHGAACEASGGTVVHYRGAQAGEHCDDTNPLRVCRYAPGRNPSSTNAASCMIEYHTGSDYDAVGRPDSPYHETPAILFSDANCDFGFDIGGSRDLIGIPPCRQDVPAVCPSGEGRVLISGEANIFAPCRRLYFSVVATLVRADETNDTVTIGTITVATVTATPGSQVDSERMAMLVNARSTANGLVELLSTMPTVSLQLAQDGSSNVLLDGGVANANANGIWTATVSLTGGSATPVSVAVVTVSVLPTPDDPTFAVATTRVQADETNAPVPIGAITVATDVDDVDGDALTATLSGASAVPGGLIASLFETAPTVSLTGGSIITLDGGVANANANGLWTATVQLTGGSANPVDVAVVTVTVTATPDDPDFSVSTTLAQEDETDDPVTVGTITVASVEDVDGDSLTATLSDAHSTPGGAIASLFSTAPTVTLQTQDGSSNVLLDGGVAAANAHGTWTATVSVGDGTGRTVSVAVVTVSVVSQADDPTFASVDELVQADETNAPVTIGTITVATDVDDVDGDTLAATLSGERAMPGGSVTALFSTAPTVAVTGSIITLDGGVANADANGSWTATVLLDDGTGRTVSVAVVTVTVAATPDDPTLTAATTLAQADETDGLVSIEAITVAAGVGDVDGDALTATLAGARSTPGGLIASLFATPPTVAVTGSSITLGGGVAAANANGIWTATVRLTGGSPDPVDVAVVTVTVAGMLDYPNFSVLTTSVQVAEMGNPVSIGTITVATVQDVDGDALTVSVSGARAVPGGAITALFSTAPTVSLQAAQDGSSNVLLEGGVANANANGIWTATVSVGDGTGRTVSVAVVTVTVAATADDPTLTVSTTLAQADETNAPVIMGTITVATGVGDVDGDALTVSVSGARAVPGGAITALFSTAPKVSLTGSIITLDGGVANADANGIWTATVSVGDGTGRTVSVAVVTVTVAATPDDPTLTGVDELVQADETNAPVTIGAITVATGVGDVDGDALTVALSSVRAAPGGLITALFSTAPKVSLTGSSITLDGGVANADANGIWTATVSVGDGTGRTVSVAVVTVTVNPMPDDPTFVPASMTAITITAADGPAFPGAITAATNVEDVDGDVLTAFLQNARATTARTLDGLDTRLFSPPPTAAVVGGSITVGGGTVRAGASGEWTATVLLNDGRATASIAVATISIVAPPSVFVIEPLDPKIDSIGIGAVVTAGVLCRLVGGTLQVPCSDRSVTVSAWGACTEDPPSDPERSCTRISVASDSDEITLTLNVGGEYTVWWAGMMGLRPREGIRAVEYYARPVLGLGDDFPIPAGETVDVTVGVGSYGAARSGATATVSAAVTGPGMAMMATAAMTVSTTIAYPGEKESFVIEDVSLAHGQALTVSLLALPTMDYTTGRAVAMLTADEAVNVSGVVAVPALISCGRESHNIPSGPCPDGAGRAWTLSVDVQRWQAPSTPLTVQASWLSAGAGTPTRVISTGVSGTKYEDTKEVDTLLSNLQVGSTGVLIVDLRHNDGSEDMSVVLEYPVVSGEFGAGRELLSPPGQEIVAGRYARAANGHDLANPAIGGGEVPPAVREGPPGYGQGSPIYDFSVRLQQGVRAARVLALFPAGVPSGAGWYYKYREMMGWMPFMDVRGDQVRSAPGLPCPRPDIDNEWSAGLTAGHRCVRLIVSDGGANDDDEIRNGVVVDPGAAGRGIRRSGIRGGDSSTLSLWGLLLIGLIVAASLAFRAFRTSRRPS